MNVMAPPVISADWLTEQLAAHRTDVPVIVHVGTTMAGDDPYASYLTCRLPSARYASLDEDLAAPPAPVAGRHPLPTSESFSEVLGRLGIGRATSVVAYDDRNGAFAARLVWMLRIIGQSAALLDGGLGAWTGSFESGPITPIEPALDRSAVPWPDDAIATADEVAAHLERGGVVIDARDPQRYGGEVEPIDMVAGHIPGAINLPFTDNMVNGRWRTNDEQGQRFRDLDQGTPAIVYCGSGVTACHNALAIEAAGLPTPRVFVGSWSGWSTDPRRPVAQLRNDLR